MPPTPHSCPACGLATDRAGLCAPCAPAGDLLHADPAIRLAALARAAAADRPRVLLAAMRGGSLWTGTTADGQALAPALLTWLMHEGGTRVFARYLAEDARFGSYSYATLSHHDRERAMLRAPVWLAAGRDPRGPHELMRGWWGRVDLLAAAAFRLGSCKLSPAELDAAIEGMPGHFRMWARMAADRARRNPSTDRWRATDDDRARAAVWRRWPLTRLEGPGVCCCTTCGEALPADGPCLFCGVDPDLVDGPTLLPIEALFTDRSDCPSCGIDRCMAVVPVRCPGCGEAIEHAPMVSGRVADG